MPASRSLLWALKPQEAPHFGRGGHSSRSSKSPGVWDQLRLAVTPRQSALRLGPHKSWSNVFSYLTLYHSPGLNHMPNLHMGFIPIGSTQEPMARFQEPVARLQFQEGGLASRLLPLTNTILLLRGHEILGLQNGPDMLIFFWLCLWHLVPPIREWTHAPCIGSMESYPLDRQETPWYADFEWLMSDTSGFPGGASDKEPSDSHWIPGSGRSPWRRAWQPSPVFLPGESHGQRSLVGHSPWGHKASVTTKVT